MGFLRRLCSTRARIWAQVLLWALLLCGRTSSTSLAKRKVVLVAGNFTIDGKRLNMAQFDLSTNSWLKDHNSQLFQYSEENAVIYDVAVNHSDPFDMVYAAGLFDTASRLSQTQLCSVARFDGASFEKVGEGVCSRGDISSIAVETIVLGDKGDLFVGGAFATRLWDGRRFVYAYHVARYDAHTAAWLPLSGGGELKRDAQNSGRVNALAWDQQEQRLFIGGAFDSLDGRAVSPGLVTWTSTEGVQSFIGGGVYGDSVGEIIDLALDESSQSLFVAGSFMKINKLPCQGIAMWNMTNSSWRCLFDAQFQFDAITAITIDQHSLYVAGRASSTSSWREIHGENRMENTVASLQFKRFPETPKLKEAALRAHPNEPLLTRPNERLVEPLFRWRWLPGFRGVGGSIHRLTAGAEELSGALFIACDSTNIMDSNSSAVLLWTPSADHTRANVTALGASRYPVEGLVTAVFQTVFPGSSDSPDSPNTSDDDSLGPTPRRSAYYTFLILLSCVALGILLGLGATIGCLYKQRLGDDINAMPSFMPGIPLKTLSEGLANPSEFKETFERAMKTRHLSTYETLILINPKEIVLSRIIGEGSFGRVWSGRWRNNSVAVKEFVFAQAAIAGGSLQRTNIIEEIVGEAGVMACLRHPKILQLYGCSITLQAIWIVSELCIRGSLKMLLMDPNNKLNLLQSLSILIDVADGMQYLHQRTPPIIHRDLKSHNIFITEITPGKYIAKIGDWGSARAVALTGSKSMTQGVGTACWLSPEVINNAHFSKASDVYAFGIILWEVHTRQEIYEGLSAAQIIAKVANEGLRPQIPRDCVWSKIMTQCWKQDPNQRPSFETILSALSRTQHKLMLLQQHHAHRGKERHLHGTGTNDTAHTPTTKEAASSSSSSSRRDQSQTKKIKSTNSMMELAKLVDETMLKSSDIDAHPQDFGAKEDNILPSVLSPKSPLSPSRHEHTVRPRSSSQPMAFSPEKKSLDTSVDSDAFKRSIALERNISREESSAHHLAPEIAAFHVARRENDFKGEDEPPDPFNFLFQKKNLQSKVDDT